MLGLGGGDGPAALGRNGLLAFVPTGLRHIRLKDPVQHLRGVCQGIRLGLKFRTTGSEATALFFRKWDERQQSSLTDRIISHTRSMALEISPNSHGIVCDLCVSGGQQSSGQWPAPGEETIPAMESISSADQALAYWLDGEVSACSAGDTGSPVLGRSPGEGHGNPLQYSWVPAHSSILGFQPTPVFLPGESHGQRRLAGYSPWGHKELGWLND